MKVQEKRDRILRAEKQAEIERVAILAKEAAKKEYLDELAKE